MLEVVLIIAAIITLQIFISIIGKVINNNGNSLFEYVYSAFDDNDAIPMTINILLNVVTPVVMILATPGQHSYNTKTTVLQHPDKHSYNSRTEVLDYPDK